MAFSSMGMSLTLMIKGHNIDSEISTNKNMQRLGHRYTKRAKRTAPAAPTIRPRGVGQLLDLRHRRPGTEVVPERTD